MSLYTHLVTRLAGEKQHDRGLCSVLKKKYSTSASLSCCYSGGLVQDLKVCSTSLPTREHIYIFIFHQTFCEFCSRSKSLNAFSSLSSTLGHQSWSWCVKLRLDLHSAKYGPLSDTVINQWQAVVCNFHFSCVHTWCTSIKTTVNSRLSTVVSPP